MASTSYQNPRWLLPFGKGLFLLNVFFLSEAAWSVWSKTPSFSNRFQSTVLVFIFTMLGTAIWLFKKREEFSDSVAATLFLLLIGVGQCASHLISQATAFR